MQSVNEPATDSHALDADIVTVSDIARLRGNGADVVDLHVRLKLEPQFAEAL